MSLLIKGVSRLSQLIIDCDKDWQGYPISNIGAPPADLDVLARGLLDIYSCDYGLNWADLGVITSSGIGTMAYLGNGIAILGDWDWPGHVWRSTDYGLNWTDLGVIASGWIIAMAYLGNGIAILGDSAGHVWRSTSAFQLWRG